MFNNLADRGEEILSILERASLIFKSKMSVIKIITIKAFSLSSLMEQKPEPDQSTQF